MPPVLQYAGFGQAEWLAFAAGCPFIVTHNVRHFAGSEKLGVEAVTPGAFMQMLKGAAP